MYFYLGAGLVRIFGIVMAVKAFFTAKEDREDAEKFDPIKSAIKTHRDEVVQERKEVEDTATEIKTLVTKLNDEAATDAEETKKKEAEVTSSTTAIKEYLKGEGFNVEEIYPE